MKTKILISVGTRPEVIKIAPLFHELKKINEFEIFFCLTGQHSTLANNIINFFQIKVDFNLSVMKKNQSINELSASITKKFSNLLNNLKPSLVIVHGDTTSALISAQCAFFNKIDVAHIESGLRTNTYSSPWPEEVNRRIISVIAKYNFCPTQDNVKNLKLFKESTDQKVFLTGNTIIDSMRYVFRSLDSQLIHNYFLKNIKIDTDKDKFVLITCHRRENFGINLLNICNAIKFLANHNKSIKFIFPVHYNPNIKDKVFPELTNIDNVYLIKPLQYEYFLYLLSKSLLLISDSGGIQEEAIEFTKPLILLRDNTERPEALNAKFIKMCGANKDEIILAFNSFQLKDFKFNKIMNPFGKKNASKKIASILKNNLSI